MLLDKLALQLTHKSDKMINKYRQLLLNDMQVSLLEFYTEKFKPDL